MRGRRLSGASILAFSLLFATSSGVAQAASAAPQKAPKPVHTKVSYNLTWTFRSKKLHRCIKFRDKGTIHFTRQALPNPHDPPPEFKFTSIKLTNPLLTATVTHYTKSHKCTTRATLSKLSMGQHWTGYACSFNPSLSASFPWGVSIGGWPNCGNRRQARFTGPPFGRSSHYTQANSGSPTRFGNETINFQAPAPCYGVFVSAVGFINSHTSDSYGANGTHSGKVCLRKG